MTKDIENGGPPGPLIGELPPPPDVATRMALAERLQGHTTSGNWLPKDVWPKLDELREEQLRLRRRAASSWAL